MQCSQMQFSVLIPTFKRSHLLSHAIEAALGQTHADREILVIDDGSPYETGQVVARFGDKVRYLRQENKGKAAALNLGISQSKGDVIIAIAGQSIANIYDYTYALDVLKIGQPAKVLYLRDGKQLETMLTPAARK